MDKRDEFDKLMLTYFEAFIDEDELKDKLFALIDQPAPDLSDEKDKEIAKLTEQLTFALGDCERLEEALEKAPDLSGVVKVCEHFKDGNCTVFKCPDGKSTPARSQCNGTGHIPVEAGDIEKIIKAAQAVIDVTHESRGVDGWHLNGDVATWDEMEPVRELEEALGSLKIKEG